MISKRKPMEHPLSNPRGLQFRAKRKKTQVVKGILFWKEPLFLMRLIWKEKSFQIRNELPFVTTLEVNSITLYVSFSLMRQAGKRTQWRRNLDSAGKSFIMKCKFANWHSWFALQKMIGPFDRVIDVAKFCFLATLYTQTTYQRNEV